MAKDNPKKTSDPGKAKTKQKNTRRPRNRWLKADWVREATKAGVENADKMSVRELRTQLKKLKKNGILKDKRKENGGARDGAGRKTKEDRMKELGISETIDNHISEEVDVIVTNKRTGTVTTEKRSSLQATLDMLREEAIKRKNVGAAKEYLDRTLGRARQQVEHSGTIKQDEQAPPTKAQRAAAQAYLDAVNEDEDNE